MSPELLTAALAAGVIAGSVSAIWIRAWLLRRCSPEAQGCRDIACEAMRSGAWQLPADTTHDDARLGDAADGFDSLEGWP